MVVIVVVVAAVAVVAFSPPGVPSTRRTKIHRDRQDCMTANDDNQDYEGQGPVWDPIQQIYLGDKAASSRENDVAMQSMIQENQGSLPIFGYGSLCWKPGGLLAHPKVMHKVVQAVGYRRCWAQKSADHRGVPRFPGIVCTLLRDDEVTTLRSPPPQLSSRIIIDDPQNEEEEQQQEQQQGGTTPSFTDGVLYIVPPELVEECLADLDFREKGGYARDIIEVLVPTETQETKQVDKAATTTTTTMTLPLSSSSSSSFRTMHALLYRGTPDNPAMWPRALRDLPYAAAVISVAIGPSVRKNELP